VRRTPPLLVPRLVQQPSVLVAAAASGAGDVAVVPAQQAVMLTLQRPANTTAVTVMMVALAVHHQRVSVSGLQVSTAAVWSTSLEPVVVAAAVVARAASLRMPVMQMDPQHQQHQKSCAVRH
jgi:hypothetical protein